MLDDRIQKTPITEEDWSLGSPDAPATLLEYGDFECPYCAMARPELESVVEADPDTIRLVYRHFPITTIHPHALTAAEAAEAAGAQGKFWEMHDMLFENQDRLEYEDLVEYAEEIGLDVKRFDREMKSRRYEGEVKKDFRQGMKDGVNGTPTIFINRIRYDGPRDQVSILAAVAAVLKAEGERAA
jgi:protein-disulfide isomerase